MNLTRILIVDDESTLRTTMAELLIADDREIIVASSGEEAMAYLEDGPFDLLIVDLVMPGIDGLQVMDMAHKLSPQAKLIMLTAYGTLDSSVQAMRRGAVDFLRKPASAPEIEAAVDRALQKRYEEARKDELLGQIQSALQELRGSQDKPAATTPSHPRRERFLQSRNIIIDLQKHIVTMDGGALDLTPTELRLLSTLIANADQVMSCRELVYQVQNYETDEREARSIIRVYIRRLRQKIEPEPSSPAYILNVRGAGYMFSSSETARLDD
ncbi:MAG: response regulator transcription factor [Anaerolineae bacterium]|nr:response regulator transcription factor [Anaerolineae bacterium]